MLAVRPSLGLSKLPSDAAMALPFPGPGSAPSNHSALTMSEAASLAGPVSVMVAAPPVGFGETLKPLTVGRVLSTTRIVVAVAPQLPAASLPPTQMVWGP